MRMKVWCLVALGAALSSSACGEAGPQGNPRPGTDDFHGPVIVASGERFGLRPAGDRGQCELHHVVFEDDEVPIVNGFPYMDDARMYDVEGSRFPNASLIGFGECSMKVPGAAHAAAVAFCPECRAEELQWEQETAAEGRPCAYDFKMRERLRSWIAGFPRVGP